MSRLIGAAVLLASIGLSLTAVDAGGGGDKGKGQAKGKGKGVLDPAQIFRRLDVNRDGKLSKAEFLKIADKAKDAGKADKLKEFLGKAYDKISPEGTMTLDQFTEARGKMRENRKGKRGDLKKKKGNDDK